MTADWLSVVEGQAPLLLSFPHAGTDLAGLEQRLVSPWLARKDTDWWIAELYDFAGTVGASTIQTNISRTVIDVNRDPSGQSLYPGQATTGLCPLTTFDGETLYLPGQEPQGAEIAARCQRWFEPYHAALRSQLDRLRARHPNVVLYDCHSIRSAVPRLFAGTLPVLNLGTNEGRSADAGLVAGIDALMASSGQEHVINGRFRGGYITRHYGRPAEGVHALQMELACRAYILEPPEVDETNWPPPFDPDFAGPLRKTLIEILETAGNFAAVPPRPDILP